MKVDEAQLVRLEERLSKGETPADAAPVLLELLRHYLQCPYRKDMSQASTERRLKGRKSTGAKKGHGRLSAADYPGAGRVSCPHPDRVLPARVRDLS